MLCILTALGICSADQAVKKKIDAMPEETFPKTLPGGFLLQRHHNKGFILNRCSGRRLLILLSCIPACLFAIGWFVFLILKRCGLMLRFGAALLCGGAVSNTWDRVTKGAVTDYLSLPPRAPGRLRRIIFNLADVSLLLGAIVTSISALFD